MISIDIIAYTLAKGAASKMVEGIVTGVIHQGTVPTYFALPTGLDPSDSGKTWQNQEDGLFYVWNGSSFPPSGKGINIAGSQGEKILLQVDGSKLQYKYASDAEWTTLIDFYVDMQLDQVALLITEILWGMVD